MSSDYVITIRCDEPEDARRALQVLKSCDREGRISLKGAIIVEGAPDGRIRLPEDVDMVAGVTTGAGSLIGMLMDILGGPLGMLLGWRGAAMIGAAVDLRMAEKRGPIGDFSTTVRMGKAAVLADLSESDPAILNEVMGALGATVIRRPADLVLEEMAAAEEASTAAETAALRVLREQHTEERRQARSVTRLAPRSRSRR